MKKLVILLLGILLVSSVFSVYVLAVQEGSQAESQNLAQGQIREQIQEQVQSRISERKNITFVPWQKRNESECLEGCKCVGAVVSCTTENGKVMTIEAGRSGNVITIIVNKTNVSTELEIEQEITINNKTKIKAKVSSGKYIEIKIMPDTASEKALERLKLKVCTEENNCTIELKEVPVKNQRKLAYELQAERHAKLLGLFRAKMKMRAQVNAETGEIIIVKKPWWAFLASEPEE